jgi:hypothetical protein
MRASKAIALSLLPLVIVCRGPAQDYLAGVRGGNPFEDDMGKFQKIILLPPRAAGCSLATPRRG